jgi:predicted nuclease of restriction endonuclease-like RecB superfamily
VATASALDFVAERGQLRRQLRPVHRRCVLLGAIEFARLQRTDRTVGGLGQIEDDGMRVELRRRIPVHRPRAVVFEQGGHEVPGRLRAAIAAEPRLHVRSSSLSATRTLSRCASRTRSSPPTNAVIDTLFGDENVASQPTRCSIVVTVSPRAFFVSRAL